MELNLISMLMFCNNLSYFLESVFFRMCFTHFVVLARSKGMLSASLGYLFLTVFDFDWVTEEARENKREFYAQL